MKNKTSKYSWLYFFVDETNKKGILIWNSYKNVWWRIFWIQNIDFVVLKEWRLRYKLSLLGLLIESPLC